jgi:hypothetical protein
MSCIHLLPKKPVGGVAGLFMIFSRVGDKTKQSYFDGITARPKKFCKISRWFDERLCQARR